MAGEWLIICCKGWEQPGSVIFPNFLATALAGPPWWFFGFLGRDPGGCELVTTVGCMEMEMEMEMEVGIDIDELNRLLKGNWNENNK